MKPSSNEHQDPASTCELQEAEEDLTMNSKSQLESPSETDDSYFLSKMYYLLYTESSIPTASNVWIFGRDWWIASLGEFQKRAKDIG